MKPVMNLSQIPPKVSIIVPVYNTSKFLGECLDSLLTQTYQNIEVICIDDGSTDNSLSILRFYAERDNRVSYFCQQNQGLSSARNKGIQLASGQYICFLDSDDYFRKDAIQECVNKFLKYNDLDVVLFNMAMFFPDGVSVTCLTGRFFESKTPFLSSKLDEICINFTNATAGMFRRELLSKNLFPKGVIFEDWIFMVHLMSSQNIKCFWMSTVLYYYRRGNTGSITANVSYKCLDLFHAYREADACLNKDNAGRRQLFINDYKILSESIGFLVSRLFNCPDEKLVDEFLSQLLEVLSKFPSSYFIFLKNFLTPNTRKLAEFLYNQEMKGTSSTTQLRAIFLQAKKYYQKHEKRFRRLQRLLYIKHFISTLIKKTMRICLPSYRVASSTREELMLARQDISSILYLNERMHDNCGPKKTYTENQSI